MVVRSGFLKILHNYCEFKIFICILVYVKNIDNIPYIPYNKLNINKYVWLSLFIDERHKNVNI